MEVIAVVVALVAGLLTGAAIALSVDRRVNALKLQVALEAAQADNQRQLATLTERVEAGNRGLEQGRVELARQREEFSVARADGARARELVAGLEADLAQERSQSREKLQLLEQARETLVTQFKTLANEILEEKSKRFSEQNRGELDLLLRPLGEKIALFEKKVEETYVNEAKERFSLAEEVRRLQATNLQISQEATNLTRALKGESKTRGNWGEVILERVLEQSGLQKGREYEVQVTLDGLRPDVVVRLPENRHIVIDSKVSLNAYDRYYSSDDEAAREVALKEHIASVKRHVDDLASKNYQGRTGINAPDFVAMFVPIEPAFNLAAGHDASLYSNAFEKKVVIVTPGTLLAMLSTVGSLWRRELQSHNAMEIARRSGDLYDKFVGFVEALQEIGTRLDSARSAYDTAYKRLTDGRNNLVRQVEDLKRLGASADKKIPDDLLARSESEPRESLPLPEESRPSARSEPGR